KDLNGEPKKFKEISSLLFRESNGQDKIGFKRDQSGRLVLVIDYPFMVFHKSPWNENSALNLPIIVGSLAIMVLALLLWPVGAFVSVYYAVRSWKDQARWIGSKIVETAVCLALMGFVWYVFTWNILHLSLKY